MKKESSKKIQIKKYFPGQVQRYFAAGMFFALLASVFEMLRPEIIARVIDFIDSDVRNGGAAISDGAGLPAGMSAAIQGMGLGSYMLLCAAAVVLVTFLSQASRYIYQIFTAKAGEYFIKHIRDMLFSHILKLPESWHSTHQTGDIIQRCTMDTEEIKTFLTDQLVNLLTMVITIILAMIFIMSKSLILAGFAFLSIPIMVLYSFHFHERISTAFLACDEEDAKLSVIAQDNLTGIQVVRAFGGERQEKERFWQQNIQATEKWIKLGQNLCTFWCVADAVTGLVVMGYLAIGSAICVYQGMTVGNFVAAISFLVILIQPVRNMGRVLSEMSKANVSLNRIDEIMSAVEERDAEDAVSGSAEAPMGQDIRFDHVDFAYPDDPERLVLKDIDLTIHAGETFGILGKTGSGKSTFAELLTGSYVVNGGAIYIGEHDIDNIQKEWLRKNVGLVSQEGLLFSRSILSNLTIAAEDASKEAIQNAVKAACFEESIEKFPDGLETFVGERGVTLSGGQKQRAIIARTLLLDTPILIFDDSLSAVDANTDAQIRENLKKYQKNRTTIIISHRVSTLQDADHILVLENGECAEFGNHEELYAKGGIYREICDLQFGDADVQLEENGATEKEAEDGK